MLIFWWNQKLLFFFVFEYLTVLGKERIDWFYWIFINLVAADLVNRIWNYIIAVFIWAFYEQVKIIFTLIIVCMWRLNGYMHKTSIYAKSYMPHNLREFLIIQTHVFSNHWLLNCHQLFVLNMLFQLFYVSKNTYILTVFFMRVSYFSQSWSIYNSLNVWIYFLWYLKLSDGLNLNMNDIQMFLLIFTLNLITSKM